MTDTQAVPESNKGKFLKPIPIVLLLLSLLFNGILIYNNQQIKQDRNSMEEGLEAEKTELQGELEETLAELEALQDENVELDSTLLAYNSEIENQKAEIQRILKKGNVSKAELAEAQAMIASLRGSVDNYRIQIDQLAAANRHLTNENTGLKTNLEDKDKEIEALALEREVLTTKSSVLAEEKDLLSQQINRASILQATNMVSKAVRYKRKNKEADTDSYKKAEKIKICFDILPNPVAERGNKDILLRIVSPKGDVLAVQSLGSGIFNGVDGSQPMQYTSKATIDFQNQKENYCMYWEQNSPFLPGSYSTELYHDGFKIDEAVFALK